MPRYYGVFLDVRGRKCVVVGGDAHEALRKIKYLLDCGADVTVIAPETQTCEEIKTLAGRGQVKVIPRNYQQGDLADAWLAIVADTSDATINERARDEAESRNVLLNVMDVTHLCNFIAPALIHREDVTVAVSTAGTSPALARRLRERMSDTDCCKCMQWADIGPMLAEVRREVRAKNLPLKPDDWAASITDEIRTTYQRGDRAAAKQMLVDALNSRAIVSET